MNNLNNLNIMGICRIQSLSQGLKVLRFMVLAAAVFNTGYPVCAHSPVSSLTYTVSMEQPNTHYYHVVLQCSGLEGEKLDMKLPNWTPGYYWIMNYARNVLNFSVEDAEGNPLEWKKTTKNTWLVHTRHATSFEVSYDIYAFNISVAESYLDDGRGFISPTGVFMYPEGYIHHPVTVAIEPYEKWNRVSTGLDPIAGEKNRYFAADFDRLYDCPVLAGNHEILSFEVEGIPHTIAVEELGAFDREKFAGDLKRIAEASFAIIGDIPYKHYTYLIMKDGMGGLEHLNSMAVFYRPSSLSNPDGYLRWLAFMAHEFFHLYNVKTIRPIVLGPFDYERENYTEMLWMSEGFTVYYEYLILNRAGLLGREGTLEQLRRTLVNHENIPGHLFQSASEASFDTWIHFFSRSENARNTTISYYDKGCTIGMLLDLKIRHETQNRRSLDDVMRKLYQVYYKGMNRGFTDHEFRAVCENIAGCDLSEIFDEYVFSVTNIDYPKYLAYAGLAIDVTPRELPGAYSGAVIRESDGNLVLSGVEYDSPAWHAGLSARDVVVQIEGKPASSEALNMALSSKMPGDTLSLVVIRRGMEQHKKIGLGRKSEPTFRITPIANPTPLQIAIRNDWIRE